MADMTTGINVKCPLCGVMIPMPHTDEASPEGLNVVCDMQYVREHTVMHASCTCTWEQGHDAAGDVTSHIVDVEADCAHHGSGQ